MFTDYEILLLSELILLSDYLLLLLLLLQKVESSGYSTLPGVNNFFFIIISGIKLALFLYFGSLYSKLKFSSV